MKIGSVIDVFVEEYGMYFNHTVYYATSDCSGSGFLEPNLASSDRPYSSTARIGFNNGAMPDFPKI